MDATTVTYFIQAGFAGFCYLLWKDNQDLRKQIKLLEDRLNDAQHRFFDFVVKAASGPCPRFHDKQKAIALIDDPALEKKDSIHG